MRRRALAVVALALVAACGPIGCGSMIKSSDRSEGPCLTEAEVTPTLSLLEAAVDTTTGARAERSRPIEDKCWKRVYERSGYRLVIYRPFEARTAGNGRGAATVEGLTVQAGGERVSCLAESLSRISALGLPYSDEVIEKHRASHPKEWRDPDLTPERWLTCEPASAVDRFASLGTFLHELNHGLRRESCLNIPSRGAPVCFDLPANLPTRSLAKLDSFPTTNPQSLQLLKAFDDLYMKVGDTEPLMLFDEVIGYAITTDAKTASLRKFGRDSVFRTKTKREYIALPQMLVYAVRYLAKLREKDPALYAQVFSAGSENSRSLRDVFTWAERSYTEWLAALKDAGGAPYEPETRFWKMYRDLKKELEL